VAIQVEKRERRVNPVGNERLTAVIGLLLLVPIFVEVVTVLLGVHTFMSVHVFVGLALIPPVLLKLGSTAWRFARYYTRSRPYVALGPPQIAMRLAAPLFVAATIVLFGERDHDGIRAWRGTRRRSPSSWPGLRDLAPAPRPARARLLHPGGEEDRRGCSARATEPSPWSRRGASGVVVAVVSGLVIAAAAVPAQHRWIDIPRDHHGARE
jgi:hypothetical protein